MASLAQGTNQSAETEFRFDEIFFGRGKLEEFARRRRNPASIRASRDMGGVLSSPRNQTSGLLGFSSKARPAGFRGFLTPEGYAEFGILASVFSLVIGWQHL